MGKTNRTSRKPLKYKITRSGQSKTYDLRKLMIKGTHTTIKG